MHPTKLSIYKALTELELDDVTTRNSSQTIQKLNALGLEINTLDNYWKRITFIANSSYGTILEIGCATGNITKYVARNPNVKHIFAIDLDSDYLHILNKLHLNNVSTLDTNVINHKLNFITKIDCVIMAEFIEHISVLDELSLLENLKYNLSTNSRLIITTPIGFMIDPDHIRGFSRFHFIIHNICIYGNIEKLDDNGIQQFCVVQYKNRKILKKIYCLYANTKIRALIQNRLIERILLKTNKVIWPFVMRIWL